mgnify:CR=1 FL=1
MASLLIKNARIASEKNDDLLLADVLVKEGVITSIGSDIDAESDTRVIDGSGKILSPAMFDTHIHMREPGQEAKETIKSGTEAAINGGVTGVVLMPNTSPAIDSAAMVRTTSSMGAGEKGSWAPGFMRRALSTVQADGMRPMSKICVQR